MDLQQNNLNGTGEPGSNKFKQFYTRKVKPVVRRKSFWVVIVMLVVVGIILFGLYKTGYDRGYDVGLEEGKKTSSRASSFRDLQNPFQLVSGSVAEINDDQITVDTNRGEKQTVKLDDKTRVTKKTETLSLSDIKKDTKVSVFTQGDEDDLRATRIVIRD